MRTLAGALLVAALAACAGPGSSALQAGSPGVVTAPGMTPQRAADQVVIGRSTRAEVMAALGQPVVVRFDSGWEVWVYRWPGTEPGTRAATELVLLFPAGGPVHKARIRPGYSTNK